MHLPPVPGNVDAPRHPDVGELADVVEEPFQRRGARADERHRVGQPHSDVLTIQLPLLSSLPLRTRFPSLVFDEREWRT